MAKAQTLMEELSRELSRQSRAGPGGGCRRSTSRRRLDPAPSRGVLPPASNDQLIAVLERGLPAPPRLQSGVPSWPKQKGRLSRGYISRIDGSIQPYGLVIPENYDPAKPSRLDVVLHGRADTQNEVNFLFAHDAVKPIPPTQQQLVLEVYGRGNNAYRWAGETDVFEALAVRPQSIQRRPESHRATRILDGRSRHMAYRPPPSG